MRVIREIDRGGFGIVEEIELDNGEHVARKTFNPSIPLSASERQKAENRFRREVNVQSNLKKLAIRRFHSCSGSICNATR